MAFGRWTRSAALLMLGVAATPIVAQTPQPPVWVVGDEDSTIYMIGTVHMMRDGVDWESPKLEAILGETDAVWLELSDFEPPADLFSKIMRTAMSPERPLSSLLDAGEMAGLEVILDQHGVPLVSFDSLRPWYAYLQISMLMLTEAGFDPAGGIDLRIKERADELGIPVSGFETFDEQFDMLSGMSEEVQLGLLRQTIVDYDEAQGGLSDELESWIEGDLTVLEQETATIAAEMEEFYEALFVNRNRGFVDGIEEILAGEGITLVAVGLGHYVGPDSIPAMLEARGHVVERR